MPLRLFTSCLGSAVFLAGLSGCHCCHRRPAPQPVVPAPAPCATGLPAPAVGPGAPPAFPGPAASAPVVPGAGAETGVPGVPPPPAPVGGASGYAPSGVQQGAYYWQPADHGGVSLAAPVPGSPEPAATNTEPPRPLPRAPEPPRVREDRDAASAFPVGIPQFAVARPGVASGLKPSLEGLDWLRDNGYKAVLHVRQPGADDVADQKQASRRGLKYLSLQLSPETLDAKALDEFSRFVADPKNQPLFVYDADGMLAGGLWYLYFRTVEKDPDETARIKAARLGLSEDSRGDHQAMWLAIQKFLSEQQPR